MQNGNVMEELSIKFALRIIKLYKYLIEEKNEHVMSKQVYRSGTSIGANIAESKTAQSDADILLFFYFFNFLFLKTWILKVRLSAGRLVNCCGKWIKQ